MYKLIMLVLLVVWTVGLFAPLAVSSLLHAFLVFAVILLLVAFISGRGLHQF